MCVEESTLFVAENCDLLRVMHLVDETVGPRRRRTLAPRRRRRQPTHADHEQERDDELLDK